MSYFLSLWAPISRMGLRLWCFLVLLLPAVVLPAQGDLFTIPKEAGLRHTQPLLDSLSGKTLLSASRGGIRRILAAQPEKWRLNLPTDEASPWVLELVKVDLWTPEARIETSSGNPAGAVPPSVHYQGTILGEEGSLAAISVYENGLTGFISFPKRGNFQINPLHFISQAPDLEHVLYPAQALPVRKEYTCSTPEGPPYRQEEIQSFGTLRADPKCIRVYFEIDHDIFLDKGGTTQTLAFLTGLFNQVSTLYSNDGLQVRLSGVRIWDTPSPYSGANAEQMLTQFGEVRTSFNGDIGQLLSYRTSGGIAWVRGLCAAERFRLSFASIDGSFQTFPTYSWSVFVMAHELGHTLGSSHTHACVWNGNNTAIDGCFATEGGCFSFGLPGAGGTLMSYCHLRSVGINFSLGFGIQPGNVIRNTVAQASCLTACGAGDFELAASPTRMEFKAGGGKQWLSLTGNANWSLFRNASWIGLEPASGSGTARISLSTSLNSSSSDRIDTVYVSGAGRVIPIVVFQERFRVEDCPVAVLKANNAVFCENAPVRLTAQVTNPANHTLNLVWQLQQDSLTWSTLSSGPDTTLSFNAQGGGDATYRFLMTAVGTVCPQVVPVPATIRVIQQPRVTIETSDPTQTCIGGTVTLQERLFAPWSTPLLRRQWFRSADAQSWDSLPAARGSSYTLPSVTGASGFYQLRIHVEGLSGCQPALSNTLRVDLLDTALVSVGSRDSLLCLGTPLHLKASSSAAGTIGFAYQWQRQRSGTQLFEDIPGAILSEYAEAGLAEGSYVYRLKYRRLLASCPERLSQAIPVRVVPLPSVEVLFPTAKLCPGESVALAAKVTPDLAGTYIWQESSDGVGWNTLKESANPVLDYRVGAKGRVFLRVQFQPQDYARCGELFSARGFLEVDTTSSLSLRLLSSDTLFCPGGIGRLSVASQTGIRLPDFTSLRFEVKRDSSAWQLIREGLDTTAVYSPQAQGTYILRASLELPGLTCGRIFSNQVTWKVGEPARFSLPYRQEDLCLGSPLVLRPTEERVGFLPARFQWQQRRQTGSWTDILGAVSRDYPGGDTLAGDVFYRLRYALPAPGCPVSFTDSVLLRKKDNAVVRIGASSLSPCPGSPVLLTGNTLSPLSGPFTLAWQQSQDSIRWRTVASDTFQYLFSGSLGPTQYFRLVLRRIVSGCDSSFSQILKIQPGGAFSASVSAGRTLICRGDTLQREATFGGVGSSQLSMRWQWSRDRQFWRDIAGANGPRLSWIPDSSGLFYLRLSAWTLPIACDTVFSAIQQVQVFHAPDIALSPASGTYCQGQAILLGARLSGNPVPVPLTWQQSRDKVLWTTIPGADSMDYRFPASEPGRYFFRVLASSVSGNCPAGISGIADLNVIPTFSVIATASRAEVCQKDSVVLQASWQDIPVRPFIQWYVSRDGVRFDAIPGGERESLVVRSNDPGIFLYRAQLTVPGYSCGIVFSGNVPVSFQGGLTASITADQLVSCLGTPVVLTAQVVNPGNAPLLYQWEANVGENTWEPLPGAIGTTYTVSGNSTSDRSYRLRLTGNTLSCPLTLSAPVRITITSVPQVAISASRLTVCAGEEVRLFAVSTRNTSLPFRWEWWERSGSGAFTAIPGATDSFFFVPTRQVGKKSYQVRLQLADALCARATSSSLEIGVNPNFSLSLEQDAGERCVDNLHRLFAVVTGVARDSLNFSWQRSTDGRTWEFVDVPSFFQWYAPVTEAGLYYRVGARLPGSQCGIAFSNSLRLTGEKLPTARIQSAVRYACRGDRVAVTATLGEASVPVLYRWQFSRDNRTWNAIAEAGSLTELFNITTTGTYYFRLQVLKIGSACLAYSNTIVVQGVAPGEATITSSQGNQPVLCPGVPTTLTASLGGNPGFPIRYRWQYATDGKVWTNLAQTDRQLTVSQAFGDRSGYYRAVIEVDSSRCAGAITPSMFIRSAGFDDFTTVAQDTLLCAGASTLIEAKSTGLTQGLSYQWQQLLYLGPWTDIAGQTSASLRVSAPDPGVLTFRLRLGAPGSGCPEFLSRPVIIRQLGTATVALNRIQDTYCEDDQVELVMASNLTEEREVRYRWFAGIDGLRWDSVPGANQPRYQVPTRQAGVVYYRGSLQARGANCPETVSAATRVILLPRYRATIAPVKTQACAGEALALLAPISPRYEGTVRYQWEISPDSVRWESLQEGNSPSYRDFVQPGVNFYRLTAMLPGYRCDTVQTPGLKVIGINQPGVFISSSTTESCVGRLFLVQSNQANLPGRRFSWQYSVNRLQWFTILEAVKPEEFLTVSTPQLYYLRMVMEGGSTCGQVFSNYLTVQGLLAPKATLQANYLELCTGAPNVLYTTLRPQPFTEQVRYQWEIRDSLSGWRPVPGANGASWTHTADTAGRYYYRVGVTSRLFDCGPTWSDTLSVRVRSLPTFSLMQTDTLVCTGAGLFLDARKTGGGAITRYLWESSADSVTWTIREAEGLSRFVVGTSLPSRLLYRVRMTDPLPGCGVGIPPALRAVVSEQPRVEVTATDTLACANRPVQLRVSRVTPAHPRARYAWQSRLPGTSYSFLLGDTLPVYEPPATRLGKREYRVQVTLPFSGCQSVFSLPVPVEVRFTCEGFGEVSPAAWPGGGRLDESGEVLGLELSPNPAFGRVAIRCYLPEGGPAELVVTDLLGRLVWLRRFVAERGTRLETWEPEAELPDGQYVAQLRFGDQVKAEMLQILRK